MFKTILVAVDGSDGSLKALEMAAGMQKICGSELLILTVFRHHSLLEASMSMVRPEDPQNLDDTMRGHAKDIAEEAKKVATELGAGMVRGFVKAGQPARTIVKFGEDRKADLIVVGSRGLGDVEGFLLGSVSHKVTSLATCPVMVV
ncbi:universal stress protein UspA [Notoacmeibacter marinus]|uniref:Universal stress protein UspA n=1 Tax=Notoacmeibacter marinus TaxID=1876515 RepID=A0A231V1W5_9HYPH|nr:universal stress protein [Notoacmeibacter marinus]OXT02189.1 universal stress protein UspA [Notoacmeibacter marinus]